MRVGGRSIRRMGPDSLFDLTLALNRPNSSTISIDISAELGVRRKASC